MKFGYFDTRVDPPPQRPYHQLLDHLREEVVLCEEAGFDSAWLGEHHLGPEGMDHFPNTILMCADLACHTNRIRLGQAANLLFDRNLLIGSPEYVAEVIQELREVAGVDYLMTYTSMPWIPHEKVMRSIDLFASKVIPQLNKGSSPSSTAPDTEKVALPSNG